MAVSRAYAAAISVAALLSLGCAYALVRTTPDMPSADDPRWARSGYTRLSFGQYADREEGDFAYGTVLPALSEKAGHVVNGLVGLADLTGQSTFQVFIRLNDPTQCDDGCRTLSYRWSGKDWRLVADSYATDVMVRSGEFVFLTRHAEPKSWAWNTAKKAFLTSH